VNKIESLENTRAHLNNEMKQLQASLNLSEGKQTLLKSNFENKELKLEEEIIVLNESIKNFEKGIENLKHGYAQKDSLFKKLELKNNESLDYIATLMGDFMTLQFDISANYLENKKYPAYAEANRIKEMNYPGAEPRSIKIISFVLHIFSHRSFLDLQHIS
jgi:exonuclease VII small subunit